MAVPYTFGSATTSIPLSQLDSNFATTITLGNTAVQLGNTITTLTGLTSVTTSADSTISGLTVGKGGGAISTNTAVGASALQANTTGLENVAVGYQSSYSNTTGFDNTAIGYTALYSNQTGRSSCAYGVRALYTSTVSDNAAFGVEALYSNTTGLYNFASGPRDAAGNAPMYSNTTGSNNIGIGAGALKSNTTASDNTAVGYKAAYANTTGAGIIAFGGLALTANTTGASNVAMGYSTLGSNTTGSYNVGFGQQALSGNTVGSQNVAVGHQALNSLTGGSYVSNTCIGYTAGNNITSGSANTLIGADTRTNGVGDNFSIVIGNANTGKGSSTGYINPAGGSMYQGSNTTTWATTSDQRLKKNIVDNNIGLEKITALQVRNFEYRLPEEVTELDSHNAIAITGIQLGVIAQEIQQVLPDCVKTESSGVMSVQSDNLVWYLVNSVKELKTIVDAQASTIAALQAKVGA